jgi:hypothetical protein
MALPKETKTLADYLGIVISPLLIMVLVGSLCFFLVEVFFRGQAAGSVRWLMFWFVLAVVLIARIGIEQGALHAFGYGLAMAAVSWLYLLTISPNFVLGAVLLGIVWYSAYKLTWNCTLIDETEDASGQGLLESVRAKELEPAAAEAAKPKPMSLGMADVAKLTVPSQNSRAAARAAKNAQRAAAQTPGVWLIYFSLAALPLFGLGQALLPRGDVNARHEGFVHLFFYLAAALGLLVATSFLGLRRYLRQRHLPMPAPIAYSWVQLGAMAAGFVLLIALLLPRPGATAAWTALRYQVDYHLRQASQYAARFNPHGKGSGRAGEQASDKGQENNPSASPDQSVGSTAGQKVGTDEASEQKVGGGGKPGESPDSTANQSNSGHTPTDELAGPAGTIYHWLRILFWLAVVIVIFWLLFIRYRTLIWQTLQNVWAAILKFIADLFGSRQPKERSVTSAPPAAKGQPFKFFKNPFLTGGDRIWSPEQLIVYSYDALQSWAIEKAESTGSPQTPRELCQQLGREIPDAAVELDHLAYLYGHVVYGASLPASYDPEKLRRVWAYLASPRPVRRESSAVATL